MNVVEIGKKIADARKQRGMTQKELAEILCVTDKAVSKWERGLNLPDIQVLIQLVQVLGMTLEELLGLEEKFESKSVQSGDEKVGCNAQNSDGNVLQNGANGLSDSLDMNSSKKLSLEDIQARLEVADYTEALKVNKRKIIVAAILSTYFVFNFLQGFISHPNFSMLHNLALGADFVKLGGFFPRIGVNLGNMVRFWLMIGPVIRLILQIRDRKLMKSLHVVVEPTSRRTTWMGMFWMILIVLFCLAVGIQQTTKDEDYSLDKGYYEVSTREELDDVKGRIPAADLSSFGAHDQTTEEESEYSSFSDLINEAFGGKYSICNEQYEPYLVRDTDSLHFPVVLGYQDRAEISWESGTATKIVVKVDYYEAKTEKQAYRLASEFRNWDEAYESEDILDLRSTAAEWITGVDYYDYYTMNTDQPVLVLQDGNRVLKVKFLQEVLSGQAEYVSHEEWVKMYVESFLEQTQQ